jgi:competence protein ComEA
MPGMSNRYQAAATLLGTGMLLSLAVVGVLLVVSRRAPGQPIQLAPPPTPVPLRVYVSGAVAAPGVYALPPRSIVQDALQAAGGTIPGADLGRLNLARLLQDGDHVLVPRVAMGAESTDLPEWPASAVTDADRPININYATASELEALPRIGPALAQRIVDYRELNGPFGAIEDIQNVAGIGPATFEQIKHLIIVQ